MNNFEMSQITLKDSYEFFNTAGKTVGMSSGQCAKGMAECINKHMLIAMPSRSMDDIMFVAFKSKLARKTVEKMTSRFEDMYSEMPFRWKKKITAYNIDKLLDGVEDKKNMLSLICNSINAGYIKAFYTDKGNLYLK